MNVIQVNNWSRNRGGIEVMVETTMDLLSKRGIAVSLMARNSEELARGFRGKVHAFLSGFYSLSSKRRLRSLIKNLRADIIHAHNIYPFISPSVLSTCRQEQVPIVMSIHSYFLTCPTYYHFRNNQICEKCGNGKEYWCVIMNCRDNIYESFSYGLRSIMARKMRLFEKNVTLFIALSEYSRRQLINSGGFRGSQIVVLPNMVPIPKNVANPFGGNYAAFLGRFSYEKGIDILLKAAESIPKIRLRLAGNWSTMPELLKRKPKNSEFVGFLDREKLVTFYLNARFLIVPSRCYEVCPLVILEAMSYGLPVIAPRAGGLPELIGDGVNGLLFEPGNFEDLATKMKMLWENPNLCQRMGQAGRDKVIQGYSEERYYARLMAVYKQAIEINNRQKRIRATV
jgi:glycosyltransferase involved in cell wall biosynthesis